MWADTLSDPQERQVFHSLLAEYFQRPYPTSSSSSGPEASTATRPAASGEPALPARRTVAPVPTPASRTVIRPQPPTPTSPPRERPTTGPRKPAGLEPQQKTAGGFDASSGSALTKSLFASKGPLNKAELEKQKALNPLYVPVAKQAIKQFVPPPKRVGIEPGAARTEGPGLSAAPLSGNTPGGARTAARTVQAVYDFEGSSIDELPIAEGEYLTVIETVSNDWLKCRNSVGSEGLVPTSYVR